MRRFGRPCFEVWFRVVIAMLKMNEAELLQSDSLPDTMRVLQASPFCSIRTPIILVRLKRPDCLIV